VLPSPVIAILSVASALPLGDDGDVPEWVMAIPAGTSTGVDGRGPYKLTDPARVAAHSMAAGRPLPFDYNHQTVFAALNGSPSPASGWIDQLDIRDGAVWAHVDWTGGGRAAVASREYRFVSPAFRHDPKTGEVLELISLGLVNAPNLRELPALNFQQFKSGETMDASEALAAVAAALGLAADAAPDQIAAQCRDLAGKKVPPVTTGAPDPSQYVPMAAFADLQNRVGQLVAAASSAAATTAVEEAARAGKITPALRNWALSCAARDPEEFRAWVAAAPVIVAPGALLTGQPPAAGQGDDPMVLAVCARLGITPEQYRAAGPAGTKSQEGAGS